MWADFMDGKPHAKETVSRASTKSKKSVTWCEALVVEFVDQSQLQPEEGEVEPDTASCDLMPTHRKLLRGESLKNGRGRNIWDKLSGGKVIGALEKNALVRFAEIQQPTAGPPMARIEEPKAGWVVVQDGEAELFCPVSEAEVRVQELLGLLGRALTSSSSAKLTADLLGPEALPTETVMADACFLFGRHVAALADEAGTAKESLSYTRDVAAVSSKPKVTLVGKTGAAHAEASPRDFATFCCPRTESANSRHVTISVDNIGEDDPEPVGGSSVLRHTALPIGHEIQPGDVVEVEQYDAIPMASGDQYGRRGLLWRLSESSLCWSHCAP